jgi:hypothetical protein
LALEAGKGRLAVDIEPDPAEEAVVNQENAARFKAWIDR